MNLEPFLEKKVKITISNGYEELHYTGLILDVDETHVLFKDKFGKQMFLRIDQILRLSESNEVRE